MAVPYPEDITERVGRFLALAGEAMNKATKATAPEEKERQMKIARDCLATAQELFQAREPKPTS